MSIDYSFYSPKLGISAGYINKHWIDPETLQFLLYCHLEGERYFEIVDDSDDRYCEKRVTEGSFNANDKRLPIKAMYLFATRNVGIQDRFVYENRVRDFIRHLNNVMIRPFILKEIQNILRIYIVKRDGILQLFYNDFALALKMVLRERLKVSPVERWTASTKDTCRICGSVLGHHFASWQHEVIKQCWVHYDCKNVLMEIMKEDGLAGVGL